MTTDYELSIPEAIEKVFSKSEQATTMKRYTGLFTLFGAAKAAVATQNPQFLAGCKSYRTSIPRILNIRITTLRFMKWVESPKLTYS